MKQEGLETTYLLLSIYLLFTQLQMRHLANNSLH